MSARVPPKEINSKELNVNGRLEELYHMGKVKEGSNPVSAVTCTEGVEDRLQKMYQHGAIINKSMNDNQFETLSTRLNTIDICDSGIQGGKDIGAFDWARRKYQEKVNGSNFEYKNTPQGLYDENEVRVANDYVIYKHTFPPFMAKKYFPNEPRPRFVVVHPREVCVWDNKEHAAFMILEKSVSSTLDCTTDEYMKHVFEVDHIDDHFPDVKRNMMLAYSYYESKSKENHPKGEYDRKHPSNTSPDFRAPPVGPESDGMSRGMSDDMREAQW